MGNLTIDSVRIIESYKQFDAPAAEAFDFEALRRDSGGGVTPANASSAAEAAFVGMPTVKATRVGQAVTVVEEGLLDVGDALDAMAFGAPVYLSVTDGTLTDTNPATDEIQTVTITGSPTGGTFTLTYDGQTTSAIAYNASAATVQAALEALSNIGPGNVSVSGSAGGPYSVRFINELEETNVSAMTASGASLTGGSSPGVTIATATAGVQEVIVGRVRPAWNGETADKILALKKES